MFKKSMFWTIRLVLMFIGLLIPLLAESKEQFTDLELQELQELEGTWMNLPDSPSNDLVFTFRQFKFRLEGVKSPGTAMICGVYPRDAWVFVSELRKDTTGADVADFRAFKLNKQGGIFTTQVEFQKLFAAIHHVIDLSISGTGKRCTLFIARELGKTDWGIGSVDPLGIKFEYLPGKLVDYADTWEIVMEWVQRSLQILQMPSHQDLPSGARVFLVQSGASYDWTGTEWYPWFTDGVPKRSYYFYFFHSICSRYQTVYDSEKYEEETKFCSDLFGVVEEKLYNQQQTILESLEALLMNKGEGTVSQEPEKKGDAYDDIQVPEWRDACRNFKIPFPECSAAENGILESLYQSQ